MTLDELQVECDEAEAIGLAHAALVVPKGMKLRGFPRGELLCVNSEESRVYRFNIAALRKFIARARKP